MKTTRLKLVTIIADQLLAPDIASEILALGASGYTMGKVQGQGARGLQPLDWEGANMRIESVAGAATAAKIMDHLCAKYFSHHGVIAFLQDVEVMRPERFH